MCETLRLSGTRVAVTSKAVVVAAGGTFTVTACWGCWPHRARWRPGDFHLGAHGKPADFSGREKADTKPLFFLAVLMEFLLWAETCNREM